MEQILEWDYTLFRIVNQGFQNAFFDWIMPLWRSKFFWYPLYVFLIYFLVGVLKNDVWKVLIAVALLIFVSDGLSSHLIKKNIKRLRPCRTEIIKNDAHVLVPCSTGYSFTSSHATNHFALAMFLFVLLGPAYRPLRWMLLIWAGSIAFGQVYVGVHFPLDVLVGTLLGLLVGRVMGNLTKKYLSTKPLP